MTLQPARCTATTAHGKPCKAWAIHGSDPPRCAPHAGRVGAKKGNQNAVKHGYYRQSVTSAETRSLFDDAGEVDLDEEAALLRVNLRRLIQYLDDPELTFEQFKSAHSLLITSVRALAYLRKQLPPPQAIDWDATLDRVGQVLDWDL